jgi:hypothetical protein
MKEQARRESDLIVQEAHAEGRRITREAAAEKRRLEDDMRRIRASLRSALDVLQGRTPDAPEQEDAAEPAKPAAVDDASDGGIRKIAG